MAEKAFIERSEALDAIRHSDSLHSAYIALAKLRYADVRPVKRGKWGKCVGENGVTSACRCSLCGFEDNRFSVFNYCPNCGADMREES